jgi:hypothetical protein
MTFDNWGDAHKEAESRATKYGFDYGIEKTRHYGKEVFRVFMLPRPENRYGFETRCEVVRPTKRID